MKKIIIIILSVVSLTLGVCLAINVFNRKKKDMALSINTINNYVIGNSERRINQVLYFTRDNIFNQTSLVSNINVIGNDDASINLKVNNIKKSGYKHKYKNEKYNSYIYDLTIPSISGDLYLENAKLEITSDDKTIEIPIGIFSIKYDKLYDGGKNITVNSLSGLCSYNPYQTLSKINLTLENKEFSNITIKRINMGKFVDLVKDESEGVMFNNDNIEIDEVIIGYMEKELTLYLSYKARYILKESYIEIEYLDSDGIKYELIDTYNFYDNGYKIPESDDLINVLKFKV